MDTFEKLVRELKEKLKEARSGDKPSLYVEKVKFVYNLVRNYRRRLESIESNMKEYLEEKSKLSEQKRKMMLNGFVQSMTISKTDILTLIDKGWNCIASGDYEKAREVLEVAMEKAPNNMRVMKLLGWAYMYGEKYDDALMLYQKVLSIEPHDALSRNNLGYICYKKKIFGEAIEHLSRVLKEGTDASAKLYANYYLGLIYYERNMYSDAIHFFEDALAIGPNLFEAKYYMGLSHFGKGHEEKAKGIWKQMVNDNPYNRWSKLAQERLESTSIAPKKKSED